MRGPKLPIPPGLRRAAIKARAILREFGPREWHVYGGIALIALGCYLIYAPLGYIVLGALLLWLTIPHRVPGNPKSP